MSTEIVVLPSAPTALSARPRRRRRCHLQPAAGRCPPPR
jgi:hypothetical protein